MPEPSLLVDIRSAVVYLTLNRPDKRNALSRQLLLDLETAQGRIRGDDSVRAVVLAANGKVFSSGHDLGEMRGCADEEYRSLFDLCTRVMLGFRRLPQPVLARVHGVATAAGCQLAASCDLLVAAEEAVFATPGVKIGLFCTTPMTPLVRAVGPKPALEMLLTGKPISAQRAYEIGLVNRVVPAAELDAVIQEWLDALLASSPFVVRLGKAAFYEQLALSEEAAYAQATRLMAENALCQDAQEGIAAFLEKRKPQWTGR